MVRFNQEDYSNFFVRRARLYFSGHAANPRFMYLFHIQLEPNQGINANDMWLEYEFSELLRLGAGRNKISYGLEMMNAGSALGMIDRSVMYGETDIDLGDPDELGSEYPGGGTARFGLSWKAETGFSVGGLTPYRSLGIQLRGHKGSPTTSTVEYQLGIWQGNGTRSQSNSGNAHLYSIRVGYHPWGFVDWKVVGDVDHSAEFKLGLLGSAYVNSDNNYGGYDERAHNLAAMVRLSWVVAGSRVGRRVLRFRVPRRGFQPRRSESGCGVFRGAAESRTARQVCRDHAARGPDLCQGRGLGSRVPKVWSGEGWKPALEAKISEISAAVSYRLPGWRNVLMLDASRLTRQFAADPDASIGPVEKAPDQVDYRIRTMVQLVF